MFICIIVKRNDTKYANDVAKKRSCVFFSVDFEEKRYFNRGVEHRQDGPASILCNEDGLSICWVKHGLIHNIGNPALLEYYDNEKIKFKKWYENGKLHRLDGPAEIFYDYCGCVEYEKWYCNRELSCHRYISTKSIVDSGPSCVFYYPNGVISREEWFEKDRYYYILYDIDGTVNSSGKWFIDKKKDIRNVKDVCCVM
jgi:hypothetical protein